MSDLKECDSVDSYISKNNLSEEVQDQAEIQIKYSGYIQKEKNNADKLNRLESVKIPKDFDYKKLKSISAEALEKLNKIKPETISQASRIRAYHPMIFLFFLFTWVVKCFTWNKTKHTLKSLIIFSQKKNSKFKKPLFMAYYRQSLHPPKMT